MIACCNISNGWRCLHQSIIRANSRLCYASMVTLPCLDANFMNVQIAAI